MTEKLLAETEVQNNKQLFPKWYQQRKSAMIRISFEELKTSICQNTLILQRAIMKEITHNGG